MNTIIPGSSPSEPSKESAACDLQAAGTLIGIAEHDLESAELEIKEAKRDLEIAEAKIKETDHFKVEVTYNGVDKRFEVKFSELVKTLLDQAIRAFGISQNVHLLGLFTADNRELPDAETLRTAHVHPNDELCLRPSTVRGG